MLYKGTIIFIALMLSACAQNTNRVSPGQGYQQQPTLQAPAYPLTRKADIELLQLRLKNQNFNPGSIDGIIGGYTYNAIRQFQQAKGYPVDGRATTQLLQQLDPNYVSPTTIQETYDESTGGKQTAQAAVGGAAGGAALGAALGAIFGGKDGALLGAGIGAATGAAAGAGAEHVTNKRRVVHAKAEHQLDISLEQIRQKNAQLKRSIDTAKKLIQEDKLKIQQINKQIENKTLSKEQAQQQYAELSQNREMLQSTYNKALATQKEWQKYASVNGSSNDVDQEINKLNVEIASLKTQLDELDQLRSISLIG